MIVWRWARRALRALLLTLAAVVLLIEEWGWRPLAAWAGRLAAWPPWAHLEARIGGATPKLALALFLVPAVLLVPVKLVALWFIHQGHTLFGVGVIVAAKLIGHGAGGPLVHHHRTAADAVRPLRSGAVVVAGHQAACQSSSAAPVPLAVHEAARHQRRAASVPLTARRAAPRQSLGARCRKGMNGVSLKS